MDPLRLDVMRFSKLHFWFKILPFDGKSYLVFPWKGEQPKNTIHSEIEDHDTENYHWWFWPAEMIEEIPVSGIAKDIIMRNPITFNCFLRGLEKSTTGDYFRGWNVIQRLTPNALSHLRTKHVGAVVLELLVALESAKQISLAIQIANRVRIEIIEHAPEWLGLDPLPPPMEASPASDIVINRRGIVRCRSVPASLLK